MESFIDSYYTVNKVPIEAKFKGIIAVMGKEIWKYMEGNSIFDASGSLIHKDNTAYREA